MGKITWYVNRLRCMGAKEIISRAVVQLRLIAEQKGFFWAKRQFPDLTSFPTKTLFNGFTCSGEVSETAKSVKDGKLDIFALKEYEIGPDYNWCKDPLSGTVAPLLFGKLLNYRDESVVGNIKYLWEPSRHSQLITLAVAYSSDKDSKYLLAIAEQLSSWFEQNPYPLGPHWVSSLELGIRLINWSIVWGLVGGDSSDLFSGSNGISLKQRWLTSIYQHVYFINSYYSGHSSANNHLIGEAAGIYVASRTWPIWSEFGDWGQNAKNILENQVHEQNFADGVNKEQAISYQQFVLDFIIVGLLVGKKTNDDFSEKYFSIAEKMLDYLCSLMDVSGNFPMIGDADDGYLFRLSWGKKFCPYKSLLATGAVIFNRPDFANAAGFFDDKSMLLLGSSGISSFDDLLDIDFKRNKITRCFDNAGYYILGDNFGTADEYKLVVDVGSLGLGSLAAHGHADALSFWLSISGNEILVDPGTYAYHTDKKWRDYFRGTSAHNTIRVDGFDQSQIGGNFMWLQKADALLEGIVFDQNTESLIGSHDGYKKLDDPVVHKREFILEKKKRRLVIVDYLFCNGGHCIDQFWHFSENCQVTLESNKYNIKSGGTRMTLQLDGDMDSALLFIGDDDEPLGWVSRSFDVKSPSVTLRARKNIFGKTEIRTVINL